MKKLLALLLVLAALPLFAGSKPADTLDGCAPFDVQVLLNGELCLSWTYDYTNCPAPTKWSVDLVGIVAVFYTIDDQAQPPLLCEATVTFSTGKYPCEEDMANPCICLDYATLEQAFDEAALSCVPTGGVLVSIEVPQLTAKVKGLGVKVGKRTQNTAFSEPVIVWGLED
jgi:hypothetical protein